MQLPVKTLVATATLFTSLAAQAQSPLQGAYIGGSVGAGRYDGSVPGPTLTDRTNTGGKLYLGYSFTPNWALEAGYVELGKFRGSAADVRASGAYLDGVGTFPVGNNFSVLGRLGAFNGKLDSSAAGSDRSTQLKLGAGLQYNLSPRTAVRAEWERYRFDALGSRSNTDFYSVGLQYRF